MQAYTHFRKRPSGLASEEQLEQFYLHNLKESSGKYCLHGRRDEIGQGRRFKEESFSLPQQERILNTYGRAAIGMENSVKP